MTIWVITRYENVSPKEITNFTDQVFDSTWAAKEFSSEQLREMKTDFLNGHEVGAESRGPEGQIAVTKWRLEE